MSEKKQQSAYPLRLPPALRDRLEGAAKTSLRSLNAEIIARLEATLELDALMTKRTRGDQNHTYVQDWIAHLESRDEILDAMDMANPISLQQLEKMIEGAVKRALEEASTKGS